MNQTSTQETINETANADTLAFPFAHGTESGKWIVENGLSKKEWFSATILSGLVSKYAITNVHDQQVLAQMAVELADSLLKELEQ